MSELTTVEVHKLERLEGVIQKGMASFLAVGSALAEIREDRLYRAQYSSFEAYCQDRWQFTADYGRKLTRAVEAIASLPDDLPKPTRESHARVLAAIPEEDRADAWRDACEEAEVEGREVTTADIKSAAARLEEEDDSWATQPVGKSNMQEVAPMITELVKLLNEAANAAERLQKTSASAWMLASGSALLKHIRDAKEHVSASKPAGLCSNCEGEGCSKCFETGWVNRTRFEMTRKK
jgi:hypothetical protein